MFQVPLQSLAGQVMGTLIFEELDSGNVVGGCRATAISSIDIAPRIEHELCKFGVEVGFCRGAIPQSRVTGEIGPWYL